MQYCIVTMQDALKMYQAKALTTTGLILYYLKIKIKKGWKFRKKVGDIVAELNISRSSFYRGLARLSASGIIDFDFSNEAIVDICFREDEEQEEIKPEVPVQEEIKPEVPVQESGISSYNNLSDLEKSNFIEFAKQKTKDYPRPIISIVDFLFSRDKLGNLRLNEFLSAFLESRKVDSPGPGEEISPGLFAAWEKEFLELSEDNLVFIRRASDAAEKEKRKIWLKEWRLKNELSEVQRR